MTQSPLYRTFISALLFISLVALGLAGNRYSVPLFFGVDFVFGSIPVLVAVYLFGIGPGILAAVLAGSYTYFLWGHPYAAIVLVGEAAFVGLLLRRWRGNLLLYTGFYWIPFGMALVWLFYRYSLYTDALGSQLLMLKQAVNGVFNGLIANLLVIYTPLRRWSGHEEDRAPSLHQILFTLMVAMVLLPSLILMFLDSRVVTTRVETDINAQLQTSISDLRTHQEEWLRLHESMVSGLARRVGVGELPLTEYRREVRLMRDGFPDTLVVGLFDEGGRALAAAPETAGGGSASLPLNAADRGFFRRVRESSRPLISDVVRSRRGGQVIPTVLIGAPVTRGGRFQGVALAALDLRYLNDAIKGYAGNTGRRAYLVDSRLRVIGSTEPDQPPMEGFRFPSGGSVSWQDKERFRWQPSGMPPMSMWKNSFFGMKAGLSGVPWSALVLVPVEPSQRNLQTRYIHRMKLLLATSAFTLILAFFLTRWLAAPIVQLSEATENLPNRLHEDHLPWPNSVVKEMTALIRNFQAAVGTIQGQFLEIRAANEAMEERSRELADTNRELNAEIQERKRAEEALILRARLAACGEEISTILAQGEDLPAILQRCCESLVHHLKVTCSRIWSVAPEGGVLELQCGTGAISQCPPDPADSNYRVPIGEGLIGQIAEAGCPYFTDDPAHDPRFDDHEWAEREGIIAFAGYPLVVEGAATGVLALYSRRPIPEEFLNQLASIADGIAQCIRRKRAEAALSASEKRFRALIEESSDAIALVGRDGRITYASPSTERILGYPPEEVVGEHIFDQIHPDDLKRIQPAVHHLEGTPRHQITVEYRVRHRDGQWRWLEGTGTNLLDDPGVGAIVANYRDITERIHLEERLRQRAEELAEANRRKDEFLAMLAHELRNPLGPMLNALYLLRNQTGDKALQTRAQEIIERQVRHMSRLMDDLLDVSRITRGKASVRPERLDLNDLVSHSVRDHWSMIEGAGLKFVLSLPKSPVWVDGDSTRLSQVLGNLLLNAAKFTDKGGTVSVRLAVTPDGKAAELRVKDTGIGIEPSMLPHVFDTFIQADRSLDRSRGGLGLGLALVKGLVKLHGGEVRAHSEGEGKGTEFVITLPLSGEPPIHAEEATAEVSHAEGLNVLLIEDNADAAQSMGDLLRMLGHHVEVAHSGPEGLTAALKSPPQIVLCDLGLPGMDGYAVAAVLRKQFPRIGLVAISGYGREEDRQRSKAAGYDRHLVKPVDPEALKRVISELGGTEETGGVDVDRR